MSGLVGRRLRRTTGWPLPLRSISMSMGLRLTLDSSVAEAYGLASSMLGLLSWLLLLRFSTSPRGVAEPGLTGVPERRRLRLALRTLVSVIRMWSRCSAGLPPLPLLLFRLGVRRTRTLGLRCSADLEPPEEGLPPSKYSISREVWERLERWPRVLMVTGVPSSGSE
ncbi:hypothetical protein VTK73DRAFT_4211 [Phialemonium thermophilum]|uniref:Uncharacterized protein n=1 Tax=Phialemonium thermophilum TaxID=223376 RepID=A0ABR3VB18_9PEZI